MSLVEEPAGNRHRVNQPWPHAHGLLFAAVQAIPALETCWFDHHGLLIHEHPYRCASSQQECRHRPGHFLALHMQEQPPFNRAATHHGMQASVPLPVLERPHLVCHCKRRPVTLPPGSGRCHRSIADSGSPCLVFLCHYITLRLDWHALLEAACALWTPPKLPELRRQHAVLDADQRALPLGCCH